MPVRAIKKKAKVVDKVKKIRQEVEVEVTDFGFTDIHKPVIPMPELAQDFTLFDPDGLGTVFSEFAIWSQYATSLVTKCEIEFSLYKEAQRLKKLQLDAKGLKTDEEYEEISFGKLKAEAKLKATEGIYKALLLGHKSLSREISRRVLEHTRSTNDQASRNDGGARRS